MTNLRTYQAILMALVFSFSTLSLAAKPDKGEGHPGKGKGASKHSEKYQVEDSASDSNGLLAPLNSNEQDELARLILGEDLESAINDSSRREYKSLPPGLQKKLDRGGSLPPGWQKKLQRGEVIDRETYDSAEKLPDELLRRITGREDAVELLRVGDRILRVAEGRGTILDVVDLTDRATRMLFE